MPKLFVSCKESRIENNRNFYGCFYLGPFEGGQGLTVANALRRTLLSECSGLAIISVLIENVHHEYSTLPGVRDSVLDILLNMKEIVLKKTKNSYGVYKNKSINSLYETIGSSYFKPVIGYLKVRGPGVVRAKDLRLPTTVQCVDPHQYIATLSEDGFLNMKFVIMEGKNYMLGKYTRESSFLNKRQTLLKSLEDLMESDETPAVQLKKKKIQKTNNPNETVLVQSSSEDTFTNSTGLFLDAIFNPVMKVNYVIEVNENKLVENSNKKYSLTEEVTELIESNNELKEAFPFLQIGNTKRDKAASSVNPLLKKNSIVEYVENFCPSGSSSHSLSPTELNNLYNCLQPYKKENATNTVILEIWTNGSLHPREALVTAFNNLSNVFLTLQQTKILNPVYKNWSSYKNILNSLNNTTLEANFLSSELLAPKTEEFEKGESVQTSNKGEKSTNEVYKNFNISALNISFHTYTKLKRYKISTCGELSEKWSELSQKLDKKSKKEILQSLKDIFI